MGDLGQSERSRRPTFKATVNELGHGSIEFDGHDISRAVSAFEITAEVGKVTIVSLKLIGTQLDLDLEGIDLGDVALRGQSEP